MILSRELQINLNNRDKSTQCTIRCLRNKNLRMRKIKKISMIKILINRKFNNLKKEQKLNVEN